MTSFFDAQHMAAVLDGQWRASLTAPLQVLGVGTDTREDLSQRAFIALRGEHHDGHDYLSDAVDAGATLLIVDGQRPCQQPNGTAMLVVDDTRAALGRLAAAYRAVLNATVVAVTGSCGKTTTKELIHAALATTMTGSRAPRSFNNDIGVPLSILAAQPNDDYLVLEIGMNQPGEIAALGRIAQPDIAVITTVGPAHLEGLGSMQAIADEKAALLDAVRPGGLAVLNADHAFAADHAAKATNAVLFGESANAALRLTDYGRDDTQQLCWFDVNGETRFRLSIPGRHNAVNALAAVAVARHLGIADDAVSIGLSTMQPPRMRQTWQRIDGVMICNDAYNANPQSMQASIDSFLDGSTDANRRILVLGDMLELGPDGDAFHESLGRFLVERADSGPIDRVLLIGPLMRNAAAVMQDCWEPGTVGWCDELTDATIEQFWRERRPGDAVLLKASRRLSLERIVSRQPNLITSAVVA